MIEHLSIEQVLHLHALQIGRYGGAARVRDSGGLEAALVRPAMTFAGEDLYPDVPAKAAALMHSLVLNHPFVDGNKRVGAHAAIVFIDVNAHTFACTHDELVATDLAVAAGELRVEALTIWIRQRCHQVDI